MRWAIRRGARALVAAGALTLSAQTLAASPPVASVAVDETAALRRQTVLEVRLAWLADPRLFSWYLDIQPRGATYEVCGFVPNAETRAVALQIAEQRAGRPVRDGMIEDRTLQSRVADPKNPRLRLAALHALSDSSRIVGLEVAVEGDGRVRVRGSVQSVEDKLAVSLKLTQVPGCTCVLNELSVKTVLRAGHEVTEISSDGHLWVALPTAPTGADAAPSEVRPTPPPTSTRTVANPEPAPGPRLVTADADQSARDEPVAPETVTTRQVAAEEPIKTLPVQELSLMASGSVAVAEPAPAKEPMYVPVPAVPTARRSSGPQNPLTPDGKWPTAFVGGQTVASLDAPAPGEPPARMPRANELLPPTLAPVAGASLASRPAESEPFTREKPAVAKPLPPTLTAPAGLAINKGLSGLIGSTPGTAQPAPPTLVPAHIKSLIEKACGTSVRRVQLVTEPDRTLLVRLTLASAAAEKAVLDKIAQIPEVTQPWIKLELVMP